MAILENRDDDLKSPKKEIQNFFREHYDQIERANYLKSVYPDRYTELIVDNTRIGYGVVINALNEMRNDLIGEERPTDIVDEVLLKAIDAPTKKVRGKSREER